jgi:hypothetical protein
MNRELTKNVFIPSCYEKSSENLVFLVDSAAGAPCDMGTFSSFGNSILDWILYENRPLHSLRIAAPHSPSPVRFSTTGRGVTFAVAVHQPVKLAPGLHVLSQNRGFERNRDFSSVELAVVALGLVVLKPYASQIKVKGKLS